MAEQAEAKLTSSSTVSASSAPDSPTPTLAPFPIATAAPTAAPSASESLDKLRINIAGLIQRIFLPLFLVTLFCVMFLFSVITFGLFQPSAINVMALAASVQVAFGMVIGFVCVYIGLMMTWFGIDAAYTFQGSLGAGGLKSEGAVKSASPGLLFALGGMLLIAVSLYKPIVFSEKGGLPSYIGQTMPATGNENGESPIRLLPPPPLPPRSTE